MLLFYDIIARACSSEVDRLGIRRKHQAVIDLPAQRVQNRRARRREADAACCEFTIH